MAKELLNRQRAKSSAGMGKAAHLRIPQVYFTRA